MNEKKKDRNADSRFPHLEYAKGAEHWKLFVILYAIFLYSTLFQPSGSDTKQEYKKYSMIENVL